MIRFFYSLLIYFLLPFTIFKLIYRSFRQPDYLKHWDERYGFYSALTKKTWGKRKTLWVHAVSVGETKAAIPLIKLFLKKPLKDFLEVPVSTVSCIKSRITSAVSGAIGTPET